MKKYSYRDTNILVKLYKLNEIKELIDNLMIKKLNFCFVVNLPLAIEVSKYLEKHGLDYEFVELNHNIDEYYISVDFYEEGIISSFIEFAKVNGEYKTNEYDRDIIYHIFIEGFNFDLAYEKLHGKKALWFWGRYIEDNCNCNNCTCKSDEDQEISKLIKTYSCRINDKNKEDVLLELFKLGRKIGYKDCVDFFRDFIEKCEKY